MVTVTASASDVLNLSDPTIAKYGILLSDKVRVQDFFNAGTGRQVTLTDGVGIHQTDVPLVGVYMLEQMLLTQTEVVNQRLHLVLTELIALHDSVARAQPAAVSDVLNLHDAQLVRFAVKVIERLGLSDLLSPKALAHLSVVEQINLADKLARFMGGAIVEGFTVSEVMAPRAQASAALSDALTVSEVVTPKLILRVIASDTLNVSDAALVRQILRATVLEGIEISAAYVAPNGSITTWTMNTRTTAVSEYRNYPFNSFARVGHKYLGAAADGIYELDGDTDNGTAIIATLRSGLAQMAGSHLGGIKAAYIAARGTGSWVMRIITGHGEVYNYGVTNQSMRSTKIHIGKGLRARYFAFELVSSGQDFDLDSLEFLPIINDRRV